MYVIPEGTEELVVDVLGNAPSAPSVEDILAEVTERMPVPTGEREAAFEPRVTVVGPDIGFAMGDADNCLLVRRVADGVQVQSVAPVRLQPGELGCSPETALLPPEQLQSPH